MERTPTFGTCLLAALAGVVAIPLAAAAGSPSGAARRAAHATTPASSAPRVSLLAPSGGDRVGTISMPVADPGRHGRTIQQLAPGSTDPTGYCGPINPDRATTAIRQVLVAFFDRFLLGERAADRVLNTPGRANHDLLRLR